VGEHVRMPRLYRGADIQHWMEAAGILDQRYDQVDDIVRARRVPSPQLIGTRERATLDLNLLRERGVNIVGRLVGVRDGVAQFSGSLRNHCAMADLKLTRLLDTIDTWIADNDGHAMPAPERFEATYVEEKPRLTLDLESPPIGTVIWATGSRPDYSWLQVPALDRKGQLRHDGGVVAVPGIYALGLPFLRRRKSSFIHGAEDDVRELGEHLSAYLHRFSQAASSLSA
jgi:putative flavoprotein involved in K+ transport